VICTISVIVVIYYNGKFIFCPLFRTAHQLSLIMFEVTAIVGTLWSALDAETRLKLI